MSKYKVGDKFVLEIGESYTTETPFGNEEGSPVRLHKAKGFNSLVFDAKGLDKLEKYEGKTATELEDAAFEQGVNKGLEMAWKLIKKIGRMSSEDMDKVFGKKFFYTTDIIENMTPQEALAKLEAYEKEQEQIKVGDVVEVMGHYCVITSIDKDDKEYDVLWSSGVADSVPFDAPFSFIKTGKHIDIASILAEIGKE